MPEADTEDSVALGEALKEQLKQSPEVRFQHRLHCVLLVSQGHACIEVASWFGDDQSSVARWVRHYRELGIQGLHDDYRTGRPAKLDIDQMKDLEHDICQTPGALGYNEPQWNGKLLAAHIQWHFDVKLSTRQCQRLLRQLQPPEVATAAAPGEQRR